MKLRLFLTFAIVTSLLAVVSCETATTKKNVEKKADSVVTAPVEVNKDTIKTVETPKKVKEKKESTKKVEEPKQLIQKVEEVPQEIGASPDAVYLLDDNETESSPKYPDGEKAMKKLLKKALRKGQKGEKARFKASIVIKADGSVGRVQFTECGYKDEYKPEIIEALRALSTFTPGMKDGKAVDSWYYLDYKR